ncbi:hypothetical protein ABGB12_30380 [Actinocorallia sp. B10E7]|uniref:hypothetical protein n=1 Tax=Actinocorallia sp. B10E7 TaxID=3153558 RepID=UPI00325E3168
MAFNVNAARAQRLEALGRAWEFEIDGETFSLPTELPRRVTRQLQALDDNDIDGLLQLLLGNAQYDRFAEKDLTIQDVNAILEAYGQETGLTVGEG